VGVLSDAATVTKFRPGGGKDLTDVEYQAAIEKIGITCDVNKKEVEVKLTMTVNVYLGPAATGTEANMDYFVAVMTGEIVHRKNITNVNIKFPEPLRSTSFIQNADLTIPLRENTTPRIYEILAGFQLSPEQLDYNRQR
jgi:hypothetical protein